MSTLRNPRWVCCFMFWRWGGKFCLLGGGCCHWLAIYSHETWNLKSIHWNLKEGGRLFQLQAVQFWRMRFLDLHAYLRFILAKIVSRFEMTYEAHERPPPITIHIVPRSDVSNYISKSAKETKTSYTWLEKDVIERSYRKAQVSKEISMHLSISSRICDSAKALLP